MTSTTCFSKQRTNGSESIPGCTRVDVSFFFVNWAIVTYRNIHYLHSCRQKKVGFADFNKFLEDIATTKKMDLNEFKQKLTDCGDPGTKGATVRAGMV